MYNYKISNYTSLTAGTLTVIIMINILMVTWKYHTSRILEWDRVNILSKKKRKPQTICTMGANGTSCVNGYWWIYS